MPVGTLKKVIYLSQHHAQPNTRLIPGHNDIGYGIIEDADGRDVYVSHESVDSSDGFYNLRQGQQLEYTLENAPYLRADWARIVPGSPATAIGAAGGEPGRSTRDREPSQVQPKRSTCVPD